jgi:adenosylcobinamide-GDP ribazoletransferase
MSLHANLRGLWFDLLSAIQFLTRVPIPSQSYTSDSLARSAKFFPVVGLLIGASAALLHFSLISHLQRPVTALLVLTYLLLITGCLHEDGLADTADGFGGVWTREQILVILRDSRIGSYGAAALTLSLLARLVLLSSLPLAQVAQYLIAAHVLCRWTTLPLSHYLPAARMQSEGTKDGQGARIAQLTTFGSLIAATVFSFAVVVALLRTRAIIAIASAIAVTALSGFYYRRRIGGVTGDCFGATNQVAEIAVYLCGVWIV